MNTSKEQQRMMRRRAKARKLAEVENENNRLRNEMKDADEAASRRIANGESCGFNDDLSGPLPE